MTISHVNIGMVGAGFMTKLHSIAYASYPMYFDPAPVRPMLHTVCDVSEERATAAARRFGYASTAVGWEPVVADGNVDMIDITTPNDAHKDVAIAAARAGKHVYCEKPLARTVAEAHEMLEAVQKAGVVHAVGYNNRCIPAVEFAKRLIDDGRIGEIYNVRAEYLQDWAIDPLVPMEWRFDAAKAGTGSLGDIGSHAIDLIRYLVGDFASVSATTERRVAGRPVAESTVLGGTRTDDLAEAPRAEVTVDDSVEFIARFASGAVGMFHASRFAYGKKNTLAFEIFGSKGALQFSNDRMWELRFYDGSDSSDVQGYRTIKMGAEHPYGEAFWPIPDLGLGYADIKTIEVHHLMQAIAGKGRVMASFEDGVRALEVCEAVVQSAESGSWVDLP